MCIISDDTNHDSVLTQEVLQDVIYKHPEIIKSGSLTIRSDNCSSQYKSKYVFNVMLDLAKKFNVRINWCYGKLVTDEALLTPWLGLGARVLCAMQLSRKINGLTLLKKWFITSKIILS